MLFSSWNFYIRFSFSWSWFSCLEFVACWSLFRGACCVLIFCSWNLIHVCNLSLPETFTLVFLLVKANFLHRICCMPDLYSWSLLRADFCSWKLDISMIFLFLKTSTLVIHKTFSWSWIFISWICYMPVFVREACCVLKFLSSWNLIHVCFCLHGNYVYIELVACWFSFVELFASWCFFMIICCMLNSSVRETCPLVFLLVKLILFMDLVALILFVELFASWFLFVELLAGWFISYWNLHIGFSPRETDFVLGYYMHWFFVRGT